MKFNIIGTVAVVLASTVPSKLSFGACREDTPQFTWDDYKTDFVDPYPHPITAIDSQFIELIEIGKAYGFQVPFDYVCEEMGVASPFKEIAEEQ